MIPVEVLDRHRKTLTSFVLRARRIEAHSLMADQEQFLKWAQGTATFDPHGDEPELRFDLPPEEAFESLAARVRPLLLERDGIHHRQVLEAIGAFGRDEPEIREAKQVLSSSWKRITGSAVVGFAVGEASDGSPLVADVDLAHGWLYGDLVHADSSLPEGVTDASLNQRFIAATLVYGQAAVCAVGTLNVVRSMTDKGLLELPPEAFTSPVAASQPMHFPVSAARIGPAGNLPSFGSSVPTESPADGN